MASCPGPFDAAGENLKEDAKQTYNRYDAVVNREPASTRHLDRLGFEMSRTQTSACPSWLYKSAVTPSDARRRLGIEWSARVVAVAICGWNFQTGSFRQSDRSLSEYLPFAEPVSRFAAREGLAVVVFSHANGFARSNNGIVPQPGTDAVHADRLADCLRRLGTKEVTLVRGPVKAEVAHSFLGSCNYVVSGRLHGAVAALSAGIPTVCLDYGLGPENLKTRGFMEMVGCEDFFVPPEADPISSALARATKEGLREKICDQVADVRNSAHNTWQIFDSIVDIK